MAHKRAMSRAGLWPWREFDDAYNIPFSEAVASLQRTHGIQPTGFWGRPTQAALAKTKSSEHPGEYAYDSTAIGLLEQEKQHRSKSPEQKIAESMLAYCMLFHDGYCYGGEHDRTLLDDKPTDCYDCSSSTSKALDQFDLLHAAHVARTSGWFKTWGSPGPGRFVTVHAADDHVWIEFTIPGKEWARFDTSPHGDGPTGPRVRHHQRDKGRFVSRHPQGL